MEALSYISDRKRPTRRVGGVKEEGPGFRPLPSGLDTDIVVKLLSVSSLKARVLGYLGLDGGFLESKRTQQIPDICFMVLESRRL